VAKKAVENSMKIHLPDPGSEKARLQYWWQGSKDGFVSALEPEDTSFSQIEEVCLWIS
jgi:hypothetical protein